MNLDLPFDDTDPAELDAHLTKIDRELDALFLNEIEGELERLRQEREEKKDDAAA